MLLSSPKTNYFHIEASPQLQRSPWIYSRGTSSYLVPSFAALEFCNPKTATPIDKSKPIWESCPLDLTQAPLQLWPFQQDDVLRMLEGAWGEFAQVGLGKTAMALSAYTILHKAGKVDGILILGPESARHSWVGKASDAAVHFGITGAIVKAKKPIPEKGLIFCSYEKIYRDYGVKLLRLIRSQRWILCCDEAHNLTPGSKRFNTVKLWSAFCSWRWFLTGTPVSNYPDQLWALWSLLSNNDCTFPQWKEWFIKSDGAYHERRLKLLGDEFKKFSVVRTKKEVAPDLPETTIRIISVDMEGEQRRAYHNMITKREIESEGRAVRAWDWDTMLIHLLSICSHPELPYKPAKLSQDCAKLLELREILEGLGGVKTCIWSWHPGVLEWLSRVLPYKSTQYHGSTTPREREKAIHDFNHGDTQLFLGQPRAAGAGLNLPAGEVRIYWDVSWSPVEYTQSAGRIERGLNYTPRTEYRLVAENTVEEVVWEALTKKENLRDLILRGQKTKQDEYNEGLIRRWMRNNHST